MRAVAAIASTLLMSGVVHADEAAKADGYCDHVEGVAAATSALMFSPTVFGQFGWIDQGAASVNPDPGSRDLRMIAGVRFGVDGIYKGLVTRDRARADCKRHQALEAVRGETAYRALAARASVLDGAFAEADKILADMAADLADRRTTAQEATATRLRVEELRQLRAETHRALRQLPVPVGGVGDALEAFQRADHEVERNDGKLRRAEAFDLSVRFGLDRFLENADPDASPYFAVVAIGVNLGALFQGSSNARAAAGRQRFVRSGRDPAAVDATAERVRAVIEAESQREQETAALEADLARQLETLARLGGEDSKRYRQTVWFEWIKIKAEHAYLVAHLQALRELLGNGAV